MWSQTSPFTAVNGWVINWLNYLVNLTILRRKFDKSCFYTHFASDIDFFVLKCDEKTNIFWLKSAIEYRKNIIKILKTWNVTIVLVLAVSKCNKPFI